MKIIAFAGLAQAGKTTAANAAASHLFDPHNYHPVIEQFAGPLKKASDILGFHKGGDYDDQYRKFCQWVGTDFVRQWDTDWWCKLMAHRLDVLAQEETDRLTLANAKDEPWHETVVLIDDLRFANECSLIKTYSGRTVFISSARRLTNIGDAWRGHPSERLATDYEAGRIADETFDMTVSNNDPEGIDAFCATVASVCEQIVSTAREETM